MRRPTVRGVLMCAVVALAGACGSSTPTTPTPPPLTTDTFTGTLTQNGGVTHTFNISAAGTVTATLTAVGPDSTKTVGFSLGILIGTACQAVLANDAAVQTNALSAPGQPGGSGFCVRIYDTGSVTAATPFTYTVTVTHP